MKAVVVYEFALGKYGSSGAGHCGGHRAGKHPS